MELLFLLQGISPFKIAANLVKKGPLLRLKIFVISFILHTFFCLHDVALNLYICKVNINGLMSSGV